MVVYDLFSIKGSGILHNSKNKPELSLNKYFDKTYLLGTPVLIDWDHKYKKCYGGIKTPTDLSLEIQYWINTQSEFIVTDIESRGVQSCVTLGNRFQISIFRITDITGKPLFRIQELS